jgi:mannose-6-phosphate isomerase
MKMKYSRLELCRLSSTGTKETLMLYPLKFKPVYKNYIWGGRALEKFKDELPEGIIAECWEVSCHPGGPNIVANGNYAGRTLPDLFKQFGRAIAGNALSQRDAERFPLLVKLIDAKDKLSVQVHPDDLYAGVHENGEYGKSEGWYIIEASPGAELIYGLVPGTSRDSFRKALRSGTAGKYLQKVSVKAGDAINIPSGIIHAIGGGILLAEVQQNSNATYRVYDYDRIGADGKKRQLHIKKALDVIDFEADNHRVPSHGLKINIPGGVRTISLANRYFALELYEINGSISEDTLSERFYIYTFFRDRKSVV